MERGRPEGDCKEPCAAGGDACDENATPPVPYGHPMGRLEAHSGETLARGIKGERTHTALVHAAQHSEGLTSAHIPHAREGGRS